MYKTMFRIPAEQDRRGGPRLKVADFVRVVAEVRGTFVERRVPTGMVLFPHVRKDGTIGWIIVISCWRSYVRRFVGSHAAGGGR